MTRVLTYALRKEYIARYQSMQVAPAHTNQVKAIAIRLNATADRYRYLQEITGVPWHFVAAIHQLECSGAFNKHLHNGDPLTDRTHRVPQNRPATGIPPFTWEESAADALHYLNYNHRSCWSISAMLFRFERYNGFGYRRRSTPTPYLWSFTQHYTSGKFVEDGRFDPLAVSAQAGAAVILQELLLNQNGAGAEPEEAFPEWFEIAYNPKVFSRDARNLQTLLNEFGYNLNPDGFAGPMTADAYRQFTGKQMQGIP